MDHERVREDFVERLTGTLDPDRSKAIDAHLASCAECRAETDRMTELWSELGTLRVPAAGGAAGRVGRLMDARSGGAAASGSRKSNSIRLALGAAMAAGLVLAFGLGRRSTTPSPTVAPQAQAPVAAAKERYVLLLHGPGRTIAPGAVPTAADSAAERALVAEYGAWAGQLAQSGALIMAEKLADDPPVMLASNGPRQVARNIDDEVGGFFLIQVADSAEAFRIARECPHLKHGGTVQVRRIEPT